MEYSYDEFGRVSQQVTKIKGENEQPDQVILTEYFTFTDPSNTATSGQVATYRTVSAGMGDKGTVLCLKDRGQGDGSGTRGRFA